MGKRDHQRPVINLVSRPACTRVVGLCLANASVRYRQFPTERDIQQTSRHADSSGHRNTMRASVRLQTQGGPDNVSSWMSSTHRVLTATLCNESKRASLDQRPLKLLKNNEQATEPSKPLLCRLGSLLTSTGDRRFRQQRRTLTAELGKCAWPPTRPLATLASAAVATKTQTTSLQALGFLLGWLASRDYLTIAQRQSGIRHWQSTWSGAATKAQHKTWPARRPQPCHEVFPRKSLASRAGSAWSREPPRPETPRVLVLLVARWLAEHNQKLLCLYFCLLFETYMRPSEGLALRGFQLLPPIKGIRGAAGRLSLLIRASEPGQRGKTGEYDTSVSLDLARQHFLFPVLQLLKDTRGERQLLFPFS